MTHPEDRELLQKLISEWRSQYRRANDARLIGIFHTVVPARS
jgi:hypothetical protein